MRLLLAGSVEERREDEREWANAVAGEDGRRSGRCLSFPRCTAAHLLAPVTIILPVLKTSAVVCGECSRMVTAEKRCAGRRKYEERKKEQGEEPVEDKHGRPGGGASFWVCVGVRACVCVCVRWACVCACRPGLLLLVSFL